MNYQVKKVLCVDLDWTIRRPLSTIKDSRGNDRIFIKDENDIELMPNVVEVLTQYHNDGWFIVGITNQGGVAHGFKTIRTINYEINATLEKLLIEVINEDGEKEMRPLISEVKVCYNEAKGSVIPFNYRSLKRKPYIGLLVSTEETLYIEYKFIVDWDNSLIVGDLESDRQLAENADVPFRWAKDFFKWEEPKTLTKINNSSILEDYTNSIVTFSSEEKFNDFLKHVYNPNRRKFATSVQDVLYFWRDLKARMYFPEALYFMIIQGGHLVYSVGKHNLSDTDYCIKWCTLLHEAEDFFKSSNTAYKIIHH